MASIFTAGNIVAFIAGCLMLTGAFMNAVEKGRFKDDYKRWGYPRRMHLVTAALEALSAVLLFWPPTRLYGAILGALVMLAAIATFTRTAAREAGKLNIRCNVISPGLIVTAMTQRHGVEENGQFSEAKMAAFIDGVKKFNALDRVGEVDDIANAALYLATDASKYVTGQILRVNGGISMV